MENDITFLMKCMNPEFLQVVFDPPTERHATSHVLVLHNVVLDEYRLGVIAFRRKKTQRDTFERKLLH